MSYLLAASSQRREEYLNLPLNSQPPKKGKRKPIANKQLERSNAANSRRPSTQRYLRMDFPSFNHHHHHNRYVPPPPPPPTNFSDDRPNLYPHHQHLLPSLHLPPPQPLAYPSLPPPPPPPLPVPPPPPSYNPHQSHFTFLDAQNPSFLNHGRASPPQPRFSNQSNRFDYRTDSWSDSHRVPPEPTHRNPVLPDDHHRRLYSPDPRSENHYKPHVSERVIPSSRYRDEINGYGSRDASNIASQEQQVFRGSSNNDDHHGRLIDRYASAQASGSNSRNLEDFVEKYEPRYITNSENERVWDHHGEDPRRIHQMKGKKNEFGHNDGVLFVSGRDQSRDYEYESSRATRAREGREEFKQVQKKSVLLRIGKPNNANRNRSHDQHFSKAQMVESNNSNFRGKEKDRDHASKDSSLYVDHRMEGDREHSLVELDVSFKSNALVAKPVVTPSSPVIDNNNSQLKNKKNKRSTEFGSPLKRSGSSSNGLELDCPSSSEKAPKQQKIPVLGSVGPLSFRLKKKRKLINFKNSPSVSIFQLAEKDDKCVKNTPSPIPFTLEEASSSKVAMVSEKDGSQVSKINDAIATQNEVSLDLENDISASSGKDEMEIKNSAEIITAIPESLNNIPVKIQEMSSSACSDEIIITASRKQEEIVFRKDDEDNGVVSCGKDDEDNEDEIVEIVELTCESVEAQRPDPDHTKPSTDLGILSTSPDIPNNDATICEKLVAEDVENSKPAGATSASKVQQPIKKPNPVFGPRTWHRSVNNPPVPRPPKQIGTFQNAYIRSGNTLVRKGSPVPRSTLAPSAPIESRTGAVVRPKTPPLSSAATKLPDSTCTTIKDQNAESQKTLLAGKKIEYVKPKLNQLVVASSDKSVQELDKTQASSSDGYYKRRKNQLIRTSVGHGSHVQFKRQSGKGISKKLKNSRFSSVWTLGSQSLGKDVRLFPWKRSKYWGPTNTSSSLISRKLLLSRKRETIYTRSKHGFSLRMSKLLSVGGSSLKWSKSIEKNSKRANEEATLAVAAAEKKKREQHLTSETKRDRIFRIGLVRYKMDPSRRTLQRISDEEPSTSKKSKQETRRSYVPKRLLIGHDEYLRIGNGNQLVRNPKRRTRLFANEKVRWSLHTARSRLARKKKYCQFFTRFGKCNKDDGKCHYIHDSSKIAVCTKFLNGLCSNPDCKLTHKVMPERMQDCSYFLQGLCSNEHCPYRHVNVNSAASICEGFLKGYCVDGNECRKKHTYACPVFEATGECSQGTKCKLHHPKNRRSTGLKRKSHNSTQGHQKNSRGRYFSGGEEMPVSKHQHHLKDDDQDISLSCQQGKFAEYISLDFGDVISDKTPMLTREPSISSEVDLDELTKPIRIMKRSDL
ncbi:hypothetical protein L2E82_17839 [Cichorium intybus]|uniref:Uncharacterized protein n=1 Tax=Cichorium intybus TaxID=13427 RepID=A0ACB9F8L3_CICIN|nr:hypothetical protein L2E82_17839 [Cichorium intybus]